MHYICVKDVGLFCCVKQKKKSYLPRERLFELPSSFWLTYFPLVAIDLMTHYVILGGQ